MIGNEWDACLGVDSNLKEGEGGSFVRCLMYTIRTPAGDLISVMEQ